MRFFSRVRVSGALILLVFFAIAASPAAASGGSSDESPDREFPISETSYVELQSERAHDLGIAPSELGILEVLKARVVADPLNLIAKLIFRREFAAMDKPKKMS